MSSGQIFNTVVEFFEEDGWNFHWLEGMPVLSVPFTGKNGRWLCYAQAREDQEQFVFYSVCPVNVPPERHPAIVEFITRANYGMIIGNFEMDYEDGEVRYKTSIDVEGDELTGALIKQLVYSNVIIMDRYFPGLMAVIYGNTDPVQEIEKIEGIGKERAGTKLDDNVETSGDHLSERVRSHIEDILRNIEDNQLDHNDDNGRPGDEEQAEDYQADQGTGDDYPADEGDEDTDSPGKEDNDLDQTLD